MVIEMADDDAYELLRIYDSSNSSKDIKLLKYKISKNIKAVIFFFL